jgi:hypothetical protein
MGRVGAGHIRCGLIAILKTMSSPDNRLTPEGCFNRIALRALTRWRQNKQLIFEFLA